MSTPTERYYYGDFRLWKHGRGHVEQWSRQTTLVFDGVDQVYGLVVPAAPSALLDVTVACMGPPNPAANTQAGWRSVVRAVGAGLLDRSARADPVVWIQDDTVTDTVDAFGDPLLTANGHPFANDDVVLIRRAGAGLWSLATVSVALTNSFHVTAVTGTSLHAIQAGDEIYLVEAYWLGMVSKLMRPVPVPDEDADTFADKVEYEFQGSGRYTYSRTAAAVGS